MKSGVFRAVPFAAVAVAAGLPAYLLAERLRLLPPSLRDRPWPLDAVVFIAMLGALHAALAAGEPRGRRIALACSLAAAVSLLALVSYAHVALHRLPAASPEVSVGRKLPDLTVPDEHGRAVALASLRGRATVLVLFRGVFCPSCRARLTELAERATPFVDAGVRVLGVSPDPPDACAEWSGSVHLPFPLLSDEKRQLSSGLCGASEHCVLVADADGVVRWGRLNENWRVSARPEAVLQWAYRLQDSVVR